MAILMLIAKVKLLHDYMTIYLSANCDRFYHRYMHVASSSDRKQCVWYCMKKVSSVSKILWISWILNKQ